jgi:beta-glucosidase
MNFTPLFEFGFGLSYTKFLYSNMKVSGYGRNINIRVNITNILNLAGNEVP